MLCRALLVADNVTNTMELRKQFWWFLNWTNLQVPEKIIEHQGLRHGIAADKMKYGRLKPKHR